jgi:hypothetical protein
MSGSKACAALELAVQLSQELVLAADGGNFDALAKLDAERLQLLKSFRAENQPIDAAARALLQAISQLNERALGLVEHRRRIKEREIDLASIGRRAVTAYSATGMLR